MSSILERTFSWLTPSKSKKAHKKTSSTSTPRSKQTLDQQSIPTSLPRWETLPSPESTLGSSSPPRSKRGFDELEDPQQPVTPVKKRATAASAVASSSKVRLDPTVDPAVFYKTPSSAHSSRKLKTYISGNRTFQRSTPESPSQPQAEKIKSAKQRRVVMVDLTKDEDLSEPEREATPISPRPSAKALGKRKEVSAEQVVTEKEPTRVAPKPSAKALGNRKEAPVKQPVNCTLSSTAAQSVASTKKRNHAQTQAEDMQPKEGSSSKKARTEASSATASTNRSKVVCTTDTSPKQMTNKRTETTNPVRDTGKGKVKNVQLRPLSLPINEENSSRSSTSDSDSDTDSATSDASSDDDNEEEDVWVNKLARELGLSQDNFDLLRRIRREPAERKVMFILALHMSLDPWKIPPEAKKKLNDVALDLILSLKWPTMFKDREVNMYRLLELIRAKPAKLGLDESWISDNVKFYALRTQALMHFSEARRRIIDAISVSIQEKETTKELARSLGKQKPTRGEIELLSLLRQVYQENGRKGFFDAVDDKLRELQNSNFQQAKEILDTYRTDDKKAFPRSRR